MIYSYTYSIPYILFFLYFVFLSCFEFRFINKGRDIHLIRCFCIIGFLFFIGLRGFVYSDWYNYYPFFNSSLTLWDANVLTSFTTGTTAGMSEPGFILYTILIKSIFPDYYFWQFISTLIDVLFLNYFFKKYSKYYALGFLFFLLFSGFNIEINLLRNTKSLFIFLYSIQYIYNRRLLPFLCLNLIAFSFHFSAIFFFPLYFLLNLKISAKVSWILFIAGNAFFLLQIKFIGPIALFVANIIGGKVLIMTELYLNSSIYGVGYGLTIGFFERFLTFILLFSNYNKILKSSPYNRIFLNSYLIYFCCFSFLSEASIFIDRVTILFVFSYWILYPDFFFVLKRISNKFIFIFLFVIYGVLKLMMGHNNILREYENVLFGSESYAAKSSIFDTYIDTILNK